MRVLLDTNAYVAFKQARQEAVTLLRHTDSLGMSVIVLGELLAGFAVGNRQAQNLQELQEFLDSPRVELITIDNGTTHYYAVIYKSLRRKGQPVPSNDVWIAASALQHGYAVFTYDEHFYKIDGLLAGRKLQDFLL